MFSNVNQTDCMHIGLLLEWPQHKWYNSSPQLQQLRTRQAWVDVRLVNLHVEWIPGSRNCSAVPWHCTHTNEHIIKHTLQMAVCSRQCYMLVIRLELLWFQKWNRKLQFFFFKT